MILPIIITYVSISLGNFLVNKIPESKNESNIFRFLVSL